MSLGAKIRLLLKDEGISQKELASDIEMNYSQVSNYISGYNKPNFDFIERLAKRFPKIDLNWLLRDDIDNLVNELNAEYSRPYLPEDLIEDIRLKLEKLKELLDRSKTKKKPQTEN